LTGRASGVGPGFEAFSERCRRWGIELEAEARRKRVPASVLGQPLEPTLRRLYAVHDGVSWHPPAGGVELDIYPLTGDYALARQNDILRGYSDDHVPRYPFEELLVFAQVGLRASHLATVPALADAEGRQPVVYLDVHEDPWAVPIASSVDGAFALLARYIDRATALPAGGSIARLAESLAATATGRRIGNRARAAALQDATPLGLEGLDELSFPLEVGDLIAPDAPLRKLVRSRAFAHLTRGDVSIKKWISKTFA
jgi:hypothetical protein